MIKELDDQEANDPMEQITQNLEKLSSRYQVVKNLFLKFSQISQETPVLESVSFRKKLRQFFGSMKR